MKITMLGSGSYGSRNTLSKRLFAFAAHLGEQGHTVTVIVPRADKYNDFRPDPQASVANARLVQPWQLQSHSMLINLIPYLITSVIRLVRSWPDVVYIYKPTPITIGGLLFRLVPGKRVVLDLDDLGSEVMRKEGQSRLLVMLVALSEHLAIRFSTSVVVGSTYLQARVKRAAHRKSILVLSNGVEINDYPVMPELPLRPVVYYYGSLNRLSLVEDLLQCWPHVVTEAPNAQLHVIGGGSALEEAKKLASKLGVAKSVTFTGWIEDSALERFVQFADVAVCYQPDTPTVQAASNLKVFQYMALASVPVVSDVGDLARYVDRGKTGIIVAPDNSEKLGEALVRTLGDTKQRVSLARRARERVESLYTMQHLSVRLARFLADHRQEPAP